MLSFFKKKDYFQEAVYLGVKKYFLKFKNSFKFFLPINIRLCLKEKCDPIFCDDIVGISILRKTISVSHLHTKKQTHTCFHSHSYPYVCIQKHLEGWSLTVSSKLSLSDGIGIQFFLVLLFFLQVLHASNFYNTVKVQ